MSRTSSSSSFSASARRYLLQRSTRFISASTLAKLWKPDTYFSNLKDGEIHTVSMPNVLYRIYKTGDVLYSMRSAKHMLREERATDYVRASHVHSKLSQAGELNKDKLYELRIRDRKQHSNSDSYVLDMYDLRQKHI
ncbi:uncharacterized protein LOC119578565 [Penaeus monodon]|uniref:uncharacterized protein LOC119578565 n=1 Tax=Penaeus monodon TaxID=6687 RepID=UPI0018A7DAD1|nr:uncharacterized protein LOC119578565 [Penaeus monodon]